MTGSRRSLLAAIIVFVLISVVVVGGMAWATATQLQLAEIKAIRAHQDRLSLAVQRIEGHINGILMTEIARDYTDYIALRSEKPEAAWAEDGHRLEVETVALRSPIARYGPRYDWIKLYFHVGEDGQWSSPQVMDEPGVFDYARITLEWLKGVLPVSDICDRMAASHARNRALAGEPLTAHDQTVQVLHRSAGGPGSARQKVRYRYRQPGSSSREALLSSLPRYQGQEDIHSHILDLSEDGDGEWRIYACSPPVYVGVSLEPMATFWLDPQPGEGPKLCFMRTGHEDDKIVFQGFIADWDQLKPRLLGLVADLLPNADLIPVPDDAPVGSTEDFELGAIPVALTGPEVSETGVAEARRSVAGLLTTTWVAALVILGMAGWGIRNLVAQTNRRLRFAYAVTHELRTPLTTFQLYSDMLSAGLVPDESKQEYFDTLNRESQRLSGLVEDVLEYARLENQRVKLNPVEATASSLLDAIRETLRKRCDEQGVEPRVESDVPEGLVIRTDVDLVHQIAGVLLDNAARHARRSTEPVVLVRLSSDGSGVHLDVVDSGPGVNRADTRAIFRPFRRGRGADKAAQRGIGLGLALARNWASLLGGRLDLVARNDPVLGGARFRLTIPKRIGGARR